MSKSFKEWRAKLHKHYKKQMQLKDLEYARAHPPKELGKRPIEDWHWLVDELYSTNEYQKRARINGENRSKLPHNHHGGSQPFQKHMEVKKLEGQQITYIENWGHM